MKKTDSPKVEWTLGDANKVSVTYVAFCPVVKDFTDYCQFMLDTDKTTVSVEKKLSKEPEILTLENLQSMGPGEWTDATRITVMSTNAKGVCATMALAQDDQSVLHFSVTNADTSSMRSIKTVMAGAYKNMLLDGQPQSDGRNDNLDFIEYAYNTTFGKGSYNKLVS